MASSVKLSVFHCKSIKEPVVVLSNNALHFHRHDSDTSLVENIINVFELNHDARLVLYYVADKHDPDDPNTYVCISAATVAASLREHISSDGQSGLFVMLDNNALDLYFVARDQQLQQGVVGATPAASSLVSGLTSRAPPVTPASAVRSSGAVSGSAAATSCGVKRGKKADRWHSFTNTNLRMNAIRANNGTYYRWSDHKMDAGDSTHELSTF
jgi:hypothetical protein